MQSIAFNYEFAAIHSQQFGEVGSPRLLATETRLPLRTIPAGEIDSTRFPSGASGCPLTLLTALPRVSAVSAQQG